MKQPTLFLLSLILLAGCSDAPWAEPETPREPDSVEAPLDPATYQTNGTIVALNPIGGPGYWLTRFPVNHDVQWILVELVWDDPIADLDAYINGNGGCPEFQQPNDCTLDDRIDDLGEDRPGLWQNREGTLGRPDSPSRILLSREDIQAGLSRCKQRSDSEGVDCHEWTAGANPGLDEVGVDVAWTMYVTVGYEQSYDSAYTLIPQNRG